MTREQKKASHTVTAVVVASACLLSPHIALGQEVPRTRIVAAGEAQERMADAQLVESLREHLEALFAEGRFTGAVLLGTNGNPLFQDAYGYANQSFDVESNVDTKFNLASIGKTFTSVAVLQLVEQGKLRLDDRVIDVLPEYPNAEGGARITIRHLLDHRSGLGSGRDNPGGNNFRMISLQDLLPRLVDGPLRFAPGERKSYSNTGYIVLGRIIEVVSGEDYFEYVRKHIFKPAGMTDTGFYSSFDNVENLALGYSRAGGIFGLEPLPPGAPARVGPILRGTPAGGAYSTIGDMLRYSEALRNYQILSRESVELLLSGQHGWPANTVHGLRYMGHGGGTFGGNTYFEMYPDIGYVVVVLCNMDGSADLVYPRMRSQIAGEHPPTTVSLSLDVLKRYEGTYQAAGPTTWEMKMRPGAAVDTRPFTITADEAGLWVDYGLGDPHRFVALSETEFIDRDSLGPRIVFSRNAQGIITGLEVKGQGPILSTKANKLSL